MPDPTSSAFGIRVVVMAKAAVPGRVKTRLTRPGPGGEPALTPEQAAEVHAAMLDCVLTRVERIAYGFRREAELILAMDDPLGAPATAARWTVVEQGGGPLGERMGRVGGDAGVVFLGVDSPDVPASSMEEALRVAAGGVAPTAAVGPVADGGYWTLALPQPMPPLLHGIDWGSERVLAQTHAAASSAGLLLADLWPWHDVDDVADLAALRDRLSAIDARREPALAFLRDRIAALRSGGAGSQSADRGRLSSEIAAVRGASPTEVSMPDIAPASPNPPASSANEGVEGVEGALIFVVDDNEQNVELLQAYLEQLPVTVETAMDGHECIQRMEDPDRPLPDLVLLDVMMPRISGFEVCQRLKDDPRTRGVPVMMVTALNELGDIERGVEAGTDDFLPKPVNRLELLTRVKSLLRVRHLKKELDRTEAYISQMGGNAERQSPGD